MAEREGITADQARAKVAECLAMAKVARDPSHKIMLCHMAETWERIARDIISNSGHD
jgi:hypothetical protein